MKRVDDIKKYFKQAGIGTNENRDNEVFSKMLDAANKNKTSANPLSTWRIIMKTRITKFAAVVAIIIAVILGLNIIGGPNKSGQVFASVIQRIRNARTATFTSKGQVGDHIMLIENWRKEPGLKRTVMPGGFTLISDLTQKKAISINHSKKQYTERDIASTIADQPQDFFEHMRTLPDRANEVLEKKKMDGRMVQGFRVYEDERYDIDCTFWIDIQTGDLVRMEGRFPNAKNTGFVATDFKFDIELDDELFSLIPPVGYTSKEPPKIDKSEVNYQDLINLLRWWATNFEGSLFPPSLEPVEFKKAGEELDKAGKKLEFQETEDERMQQALKGMRGLQFVMMMKPENDWHYAGKGVELGDADTAICWYRPQGSQTYRVIYGDLSFVKDVASEDLPK